MTANYSADAAEAKARAAREVDAQIEAAHQRADKARAWREQVESSVGRGEAEHGEVKAEVRPDGLLIGLEIDDRIAARGPSVAERAVLAAIAAAQADLRANIHSHSVETWGAQDPAVRSLDAEVEASTPTPHELEADGMDTRTRDGGTW